ncbi:MAG: hypothetical protein MI751_10015, partial [Pseudomonadales bacterium]|nr:hypothetical protein [Pseudomonadales bacterium]
KSSRLTMANGDDMNPFPLVGKWVKHSIGPPQKCVVTRALVISLRRTKPHNETRELEKRTKTERKCKY